ncbi:DMT family transporter [Alkalicoccobacillus gibsonii]|uniref:DMT family transporter n=1 Tax=Alkalicoccobacillus gibsonii TaxID=79881 RepID=UPI003514D87B
MAIKYYFLLILTCLFWAGNFVFSKSLVDHASPVTLTTLRWITALVCLLPVVWYKRKLVLPVKAIFPVVLMGITGVMLFNILQFKALEHTSATNVGLISTLNMISIAFFSFLFLKERISLYQFSAMILSLTGVVLVLSKGKVEYLTSLHFNVGDVWMLAAVFIWGIYTICTKWALKNTSVLTATFYSAIFGLIFILPINIPDFKVINVDGMFFITILYTGMISTVLCMILWNVCVQKIGPTTSGVSLNLNPVFTALLAFMFLGENITFIQITGGGIVITGCLLFSILKKKERSKLERLDNTGNDLYH